MTAAKQRKNVAERENPDLSDEAFEREQAIYQKQSGLVGSDDADFLRGLSAELMRAAPNRAVPEERGFEYLFSIVKGISPRDQLEAMLAAQMAMVHQASAAMSVQLARSNNILQSESAERSLGRLTRTYLLQMETLNRYRVAVTARQKQEKPAMRMAGSATAAVKASSPEVTPEQLRQLMLERTAT